MPLRVEVVRFGVHLSGKVERITMTTLMTLKHEALLLSADALALT